MEPSAEEERVLAFIDEERENDVASDDEEYADEVVRPKQTPGFSASSHVFLDIDQPAAPSEKAVKGRLVFQVKRTPHHHH